MNKRSFLSSVALGAIALTLCTAFTFSWLSSRVDYLNTVIKMGDFGATVKVYYEDGTLLANGSTAGDDVVINNAIASENNWAAGTVGYRFIEVKNTGTINLNSFINCDYSMNNFNCSDSEVAGSFYLRLTDITSQVKSMEKGSVSKLNSYINKYVPADAEAIHTSGSTFADANTVQKLGTTISNGTSYYLFEYCCYDLSALNFTSDSSLSIGAKIRVQQTDAPVVDDTKTISTVSQKKPVKSTAKPQSDIEASTAVTTVPATEKVNNGVTVTTPSTTEPSTTYYEPVVPTTKTQPTTTQSTTQATTTSPTKPVSNWDYVYTSGDNSTCEIVAYNGSDKNVVVPSKIDNALVTSLGADVFNNTKAVKVEVPATIDDIDINTFNVSTIKDVKIYEKTIVDGVTYSSPYYMEDLVLYTSDKTMLLRYNTQKSEKAYTVLDECTTICDNAFADVSTLKELDLSAVKSVSSTAFKNAEITDFDFHTSNVPYVSSIDTFGKVSVTVSNNKEVYKTNVKLHVPDSAYSSYSNSYALRYYVNAKAVKNDGTLGNGTVKNIKSSGLKFVIIKNNSEYGGTVYKGDAENKYLAVVTGYTTIPDDGVVNVPDKVIYEKSADAENGKESFSCPVVGVADYAFENCKDLQVIVLPNRDVYYTTNAFAGCDNLGIIDYASVVPFDVGKFDAILNDKPTSQENQEDDSE